MSTINFGEVTDNDFEALPEDRYTVECVEAKMGESKAGNPKISAQFKVVGESYGNRRLFNDFSLVPKAWFNLKNYFNAAGVDIAGDIEFEDLPEMMKETTASVYVSQEDWQGKPQNRLSEWAAIESGSGSMFK